MGTSPNSTKQEAVAICFFGQVKNITPKQASNFVHQILEPLAKVYGQIDIYLHTYNMKEFTNPRNGEFDVPIDVGGAIYTLMTTAINTGVGAKVCVRRLKVSHPGKADRSFRDVRHYLQNGDPWQNQGVSMLYFLRQLYSLDQVTKLWEAEAVATSELTRTYDAIVYTRPDLHYFDTLPVDWKLSDRTIYTPWFDQWGGLNDRFAIGVPTVMQAYGHRMHMVDYFLERHSGSMLWAEPFLHDVVIRLWGFTHGRTENFRFTRVRANGLCGDT